MQDSARIIWLFWLQGWDAAPKLVKQIHDTWLHHNAANGWKVIELDRNNLSQYMDVSLFNSTRMTVQAMSDIIRLRLMAAHGGVWADATMVCMRPLDDWIGDALKEGGSGFWMYHGRDRGRGPASWFMASNPQSYIAKKWCDASDSYWANGLHDGEYFWMDRLFARLALSDPTFLEQWKNVLFLDCEAPFEAHCCNTNHFKPYDVNFMSALEKSPVLAIKLSHHGSEAMNHPKSNASRILEISVDPSRVPPPVKWGAPPSFDDANFFKTAPKN